MTRRKVAFIGLGAIGLPMAIRLASDPRIELALFDLRADALDSARELGRISTSIADAIAGADTIFSVLPADEHVLAVTREIASNATPGVTYVDFSTIEPNTIREVESALRSVDVEVLGAALTRSVAAAQIGDLSIFLGGDYSACERVAPLLEKVASDVRRLPSAAQAKALKVMNNMIVSGTSVMLCDAIVLGSAHGVDPRVLATVLAQRHAGSWTLENQLVKHVLTDELSPGRFSTAYMSKDATLAATVARRLGRPAHFAGLVRAAFRGSSALGLGDHYHPVVIRWLEHAALKPHIRVSGAPEPEVDPKVATVIADAMAVQQALLTVNALELLSLEGIAPDIALPHLRSGSAENDFIDELLDADEDGVASMTLEAGWDRIQLALDLAQVESIPAWGFEVSAHFAISQMASHGQGRSFGSLIASLNGA